MTIASTWALADSSFSPSCSWMAVKSGGGVVWGSFGGGGRHGHPAKLRIVRRPLQLKIPFASQAGLIDHRTVEHGGFIRSDKVSHGRVAHVQVTELAEEQAGKPVRIGVVLGHLRSGFAGRQHVRRKLLLSSWNLSWKRSASSFFTMTRNCSVLGVPGVSGLASISNLSELIQSCPPMTCFSCRL